MILFQKDYDGESINDAERDVTEAFQIDMNPLINQIPKKEGSFLDGSFRITIEWEPE